MPTKPGTYATFKTTQGTIVCELFEQHAPQTVANFIGLAEGTKEWNSRSKKGAKLYDGTVFHRVIPNFMIQGGDPEGTGMGGPGYKFADETKGSPHHIQVPRRELFFNVVNHRPLRGKAANLSRRTERTVRALFGFYRAGNAGHIPFIHVPGLGRHVPRLAELVVPRVVEHLQVVVGVLTAVETVHTGVHIVVAVVERVAGAGRRGRLRVRGPGSHVMARGEPQLDQPVVIELDGTQDTRVGKRVNRIQQ